MKNYYLFKAGKIFGPINDERLLKMKANGELLDYTWMIEERNQQWVPVDAMPSENPFHTTKEVLGERTITGTFMLMKNPLMGLVKGIHAYGLELFVDKDQMQKARMGGLKNNTPVQLNLVDETNEQWANTEVLFQNAEPKENGMLLRFGWSEMPVQI